MSGWSDDTAAAAAIAIADRTPVDHCSYLEANRNLPAEVCHVEGLGNEQLLTCRLQEGSHLVQLRADPSEQLTPGETVHLDIDPKGWRFFDADGEAIPPAPEPIAPTASGPEPVLPSLG